MSLNAVKTIVFPVPLLLQGSAAWGRTSRQCPLLQGQRTAVNECFASLAFQDTAGGDHLKRFTEAGPPGLEVVGGGIRSEKKQLRLWKFARGMWFVRLCSVLQQESHPWASGSKCIRTRSGKIPGIVRPMNNTPHVKADSKCVRGSASSFKFKGISVKLQGTRRLKKIYHWHMRTIILQWLNSVAQKIAIWRRIQNRYFGETQQATRKHRKTVQEKKGNLTKR